MHTAREESRLYFTFLWGTHILLSCLNNMLLLTRKLSITMLIGGACCALTVVRVTQAVCSGSNHYT